MRPARHQDQPPHLLGPQRRDDRGNRRPHGEAEQIHERVAGAGVWVLPNPSGLNAGWSPDALATAYASLRAVARGEDSGPG
ncbi:hypothetical protein ACL02R_09095 [Streptomyces sp. MS19]|uniref:hypothetical protein n=1 Tax=Streptomyces sp. MS19 TaxID=3385972 RepID=UPI0039A0FBD2